MKEERKATRQSYGEALKDLGKENSRVVVLDADLAGATKSDIFKKEFPERFFDIGIAEQDMIGTAAGMATCGKIPFASTFAVFATRYFTLSKYYDIIPIVKRIATRNQKTYRRGRTYGQYRQQLG